MKWGIIVETIYSKIKSKITSLVNKITSNENRIDFLKYHDPLTKLPNRKRMIDAFNHSLKHSVETERAILVINIDRLHSINELYGRDIGDKVIIKLTNRLQKEFKEKNTVFREDHFYLWLEGVPQMELEETGQRIQEIVNQPFKIGEEVFHITVSIGISHYPSTSTNIKSLLQQAEIAMSKVKMDGKNNYAVILQEDIVVIERKRKMEFELKNVLEREELYLVYQPEVDLKTGEIVAAEALLRWDHPVLGSLSPIEFIPIAEETGMINEIGKWVIHEAATQAKRWHDKGLKICLAVNISYVQFRDALLVQHVIEILKSVGFDSSYFIMEITESLMKDLEYVELVTKELRQHKIRIAIDDFGTGYSSLGVLGNMYIDMIKIDRSFIKNLPRDEKAIQIVKTMIQIGENLDSIIVAEGVEELEQLNFLAENNCKYGQGYYFSKPISSDAIVEYGEKLKQI